MLDLDKAISENGNRNLYAIVFHQAEDNSLQYTIRNRNAANLETARIRRNNYNELNSQREDYYMGSGLLRLQMTINEIFLHHQNVSAFPVSTASRLHTNAFIFVHVSNTVPRWEIQSGQNNNNNWHRRELIDASFIFRSHSNSFQRANSL